MLVRHNCSISVCAIYLSVIGDAGGTWKFVFKIQVASVALLLGSAWQVTRARPPSHRLTFPGMSMNRWRKIPRSLSLFNTLRDFLWINILEFYTVMLL